MIYKGLAGKVIENFTAFCGRHDYPRVDLRVSAPITDREYLEGIFSGKGFGYIRLGGHEHIEKLENWLVEFSGGADFRVRSDGMGGVVAALIGAGNARGRHIIGVWPLYGGTTGAIKYLGSKPRFDFDYTFLSACDPHFLQKLHDSIREDTAAVIIEPEGNPTLRFSNFSEASRICKAHPKAKPIVIVDDTFLFGILFPFRWGADVVVGSGTKFLAGESAYSLGYCGVSRDFMSECPGFWQEVNEAANLSLAGGTFGPFEAWLTAEFSVRDVLERVRAHSRNAMTIAKLLEIHPCVESVTYPGLNSYPDKEIYEYLEPIWGEPVFGGMASFKIRGGLEDVERFLYHLTANSHIGFMASLGGFNDMIESPVLLSHAYMTPAERLKCGITDNSVRLSVGRVVDIGETYDALDRSLKATRR